MNFVNIKHSSKQNKIHELITLRESVTQVIIPVQSKQESGKEDREFYYLAEVTATVTRSLKSKHR